VINVANVGHDGERMWSRRHQWWPRRCGIRSEAAVGVRLMGSASSARRCVFCSAFFPVDLNLLYHVAYSDRGLHLMKRRDVLKTALAGATALATPRIAQATDAKTIRFVPHADLASLDPVWTTADITRNFSLAVYDTLYGYDAEFNVQPQMVDGAVVENDGRQWDLTLRDGLAFHDGTPVLARDCIATINRFAKRYPYGEALMARTDELSAPSDKVIRFRLKRPFALVPNALAEVYCAIMPERLAKTDAFEQINEAMGSGPFRFTPRSVVGQKVVYERNTSPQGRQAKFQRGTGVGHVIAWRGISFLQARPPTS
jgi:ABC-type transport system substrate-binding protein